MRNQIILKVTVDDIQNVALGEIGRELTNDEIKSIEDKIIKRINWYEAITETINENIESDVDFDLMD
jgi:hypothetical protein